MRLRLNQRHQAEVTKAYNALVSTKAELEEQRQLVKREFGNELSRPGSLAAVACIGFMSGNKRSNDAQLKELSSQLASLETEFSQMLTAMPDQAQVEKAAVAGREEEQEQSSAIDYVVTVAISVLTKLAAGLATDLLQSHMEDRQSANPEGDEQ